MRLYVPKDLSMPLHAKEDEHVMSLDDALLLKEVMECFESFEELKRLVAKNYKKEKVNIRDPGLRHIWKESKLPQGSLREVFNAVVNVFSREAVDSGGMIKDKLPSNFLIARVGDEFGIEYKTARQKIMALRRGGYLKEDYGQIIFPVELIERR